jgi:hypothetical protein
MTSTLTPHTLTEKQYNDALYQLLLQLEESGTVKTEAYTDGKGIPTIGVQSKGSAIKGVRAIKGVSIAFFSTPKKLNHATSSTH